MRHVGVMAAFMLVALGTTATESASAGPISKPLSPRYNADEIEITRETPLTGGCTTSTFAVTNPTAANHRSLVAFLLAAFAADANIEIVFGGGCATGSVNWIQTIKLVKS